MEILCILVRLHLINLVLYFTLRRTEFFTSSRVTLPPQDRKSVMQGLHDIAQR